MDKNYCVYMHTLKLDGRKYIGITSKDPTERWTKGHGYWHNKHFYNAIQKYGWDNFKHDILFNGLTKEQACAKEIALIKLFRTTDKMFGFNHTSGGDGTHEYHHTEEIKQKIGVASEKYTIDTDLLRYVYVDLGWTQERCADYFGCSVACINYRCERDNIQKYAHKAITAEELQYYYEHLKWTIEQCGSYFNVSVGAISKLLRKYNIVVRPTAVKKVLIKKEDLEYQYITLNKSCNDCAKYFNCCTHTITARLNEYNIPIRN